MFWVTYISFHSYCIIRISLDSFYICSMTLTDVNDLPQISEWHSQNLNPGSSTSTLFVLSSVVHYFVKGGPGVAHDKNLLLFTF